MRTVARILEYTAGNTFRPYRFQITTRHKQISSAEQQSHICPYGNTRNPLQHRKEQSSVCKNSIPILWQILFFMHNNSAIPSCKFALHLRMVHSVGLPNIKATRQLPDPPRQCCEKGYWGYRSHEQITKRHICMRLVDGASQ
jgi:hypothetical protein